MDFPFDIYDVADQLGLELKKQHPKSSDYNCPFCDGKGKLNLAWLAAKYGFSPKRVTWDRKYKGIDDYLLAVRILKGGAL